MNKYLFELYLAERPKFYVNMIKQLYARLEAYKKFGDKAVNEIDKDKGLDECKKITKEELIYYLEKLKKELTEEDYKLYLNYNGVMMKAIE